MTKSKTLLLACAIFISGCRSWVPAHEYCVLKAEPVEFTHPAEIEPQTRTIILGAWCTRTDSKDDAYWKPASSLHKWISRSPQTEQAIIEAAKRNCEK